MKRITTLVMATVIVLGGSFASAQEMEKFVRYSMNGGDVYWGMIPVSYTHLPLPTKA